MSLSVNALSEVIGRTRRRSRVISITIRAPTSLQTIGSQVSNIGSRIEAPLYKHIEAHIRIVSYLHGVLVGITGIETRYTIRANRTQALRYMRYKHEVNIKRSTLTYIFLTDWLLCRTESIT